MELLEEHLPIGDDEWQKMTDMHCAAWPNPGRNSQSIRRKYHDLHRKKAPTGDPNMPPEVRVAKRVKFLIGQRVSIGSEGD